MTLPDKGCFRGHPLCFKGHCLTKSQIRGWLTSNFEQRPLITNRLFWHIQNLEISRGVVKVKFEWNSLDYFYQCYKCSISIFNCILNAVKVKVNAF